VNSCAHNSESEIYLPKLDEGSEHLVFFDEQNALVFKATRSRIFGESYFLDENGKVNQRNCSPLEYLIRLRLWKKLFHSAPRDLGITEQGQIVSAHQFITGTLPTQEAVDAFLIDAGLSDAKRKFWLWKKTYLDFEIWIGDARADNFVESPAGIVPIDIRLWFAGYTPRSESSDW
jgi:hypothetical protein